MSLKNIGLILSIVMLSFVLNACSSKADYKPLYQANPEITDIEE